jgi:hypothetical protein
MFEESGSSVALRFEVTRLYFRPCLWRRLTRSAVAWVQVLEPPGVYHSGFLTEDKRLTTPFVS